MDFTKINGPETYKQIAEALPYEIQSVMLSIRDDGVTFEQLPTMAYIILFELMLIEPPTGENKVRLSRLGSHLVPFCTC